MLFEESILILCAIRRVRQYLPDITHLLAVPDRYTAIGGSSSKALPQLVPRGSGSSCDKEVYRMQQKVKWTYKDSIFRRLFGEKENALALYNAFNGSRYEDTDDLIIYTLEADVFLGYKNDCAYIFYDELMLVEAQSTVCPNMPYRGLQYIAAELRKYEKEHRLNPYGLKRLHLPTPKIIVLCNSKDMTEDIEVLRLTDSFSYPEKSSIEVICQVYNISQGHNEELMNACSVLREYSDFLETVRQHASSGKDRDTAINDAIDECIRKGVLRDFLNRNKGEVTAMWLYEFDAEEQLELERRDAREEGREEGREEERIRMRCSDVESGLYDSAKAASLLGMTEAEFRKHLENYKKTEAVE